MVMDIEDTRQPPAEKDVFVNCYVCERSENYEDMTVIHYREVCTNCVSAICQDLRQVIHNCKFCGYEYPDFVATIKGEPFYVCEDCKECF